MITPEQIFKYVDRLNKKSINKGEGSYCPSIRDVAKRFGISQKAVSDLVDDYSGDCYLSLVAAQRIGSGVYSYKKLGDYLVEAY